jgi:hypothetical protein
MKTSNSLVKLAPALVAAQAEITWATKDSTNPHFKNRYADLQSVIEAIKPALNKHGIFFSQHPTPSDAGTLGLTTILLHSSGEWIEDTAIIPLPKNDPQGYGSAMTYGRRYGLAAICGLFQSDDDGEAAKPSQMPVKATQSPAMSNKADIETINTFASGSDTGPVVAKAFAHYGVKTSKELSAEQAAIVIKRCIETVSK